MQRRRLEQLRPRFGLEKLEGKAWDELALAWRARGARIVLARIRILPKYG
jgi:hypothetical protein